MGLPSHRVMAGLVAIFAFCVQLADGQSDTTQERPLENNTHSTASVQLRVQILDAATRLPLAARAYLQNLESNEWYFFSVIQPNASAVRYEKQNWVNKRSIEYHTTLSAHEAYSQVPPGRYRLTVERGKTYKVHQAEFSVVKGTDQVITVPLERWANPQARGWYSGDTHLHRTVEELKNIILAEDLNVALPLTQWVTVAEKTPSAGDKNQEDIPDGQIQVDSTHVIWPLNTEYEIFSVGGQRHTLGALFVLGHQHPLQVRVPPWRPVIEAAKSEGDLALFDMDKLDWPFAMTLPVLAPNALYELSNNHVWRTEFAFRDWNKPAPAYMQPPYGTQEGGHRPWIDYTLGMYYTLLNAGFRLPPSAGTANGVHPVPAGFGRVYVNLPDGFSFEGWMKGLQAGRSFVTTGPMLYATLDDSSPGHLFRIETPINVTAKIEVRSDSPLAYGELLVNGTPVQLLRPENKQLPSGAYESHLTPSITLEHSGWVAVRFWQPQPDGQTRFVHSAPWYVQFQDEPVLPRYEEKEYLVERMRSEIERSRAVIPNDALAEYEQVLNYYESLDVAPTPADTQQRSVSNQELDAWLDNMILDHRYSAFEVSRVTGLPLENSQEQIAARRDQPVRAGFRILPYPGGRHPRIGFLDGALDPQRETKVSLFAPWDNGGYVVVDVPEAIFSDLGLTYLAHKHIPTIWGDRALEQLEWQKLEDGLTLVRELPNGITFTSTVTAGENTAWMVIELFNGTSQPLTQMRTQICAMLKGAIGFNTQQRPTEIIEKGPLVAIRGEHPNRWLVSAWTPNHRTWTNPPVPCFHSDPIFPDCAAGESVKIVGAFAFYEGTEITHFADQLLRELTRQSAQ